MVREKDRKRDSRNNFQGVQSNLMTRKLPRFLLATVFVISVTALAQTASADPELRRCRTDAGMVYDDPGHRRAQSRSQGGAQDDRYRLLGIE